MKSYKKYYGMFFLSGLLMVSCPGSATAEDFTEETKCMPSDFFEEDELPDLDAIKRWEEKNPPSFFKVTGHFLKEHVSKHKMEYALAAVAAGAVGYHFRDHLCQHKYKYLLGTTATLSLATWYGWYQFNKVMNKKA